MDNKSKYEVRCTKYEVKAYEARTEDEEEEASTAETARTVSEVTEVNEAKEAITAQTEKEVKEVEQRCIYKTINPLRNPPRRMRKVGKEKSLVAGF